MDWSSLIGASAGAAGGGGIALFLAKNAYNQIMERLKRLEENDTKLLVGQGEDRGRFDLAFRDLKSKEIRIAENKEKLNDLSKQINKQWNILSKFSNPRVSDALEKALKESE